MDIRYSQHLKFKMRVRQISENMPKRIYHESKKRFYNHQTFRRIAIMEISYHRHRTLMMIAYDQYSDYVDIITIHPITKEQIRQRQRTGRWTYE